jgi:hypothetical protein
VYFVRRKGRVKGPLTLEKLRGLRDQDRLRMRDEIAESADGPWKRLTEVYVELLDGDDEPPGDPVSGVDDEFWEDQAGATQTSGTQKMSAANAAGKTQKQASLFGGQVKPWQLAAGGITAAGLAAVAVVAGLFLSPVSDQPTDPDEIAANTNEASPARRTTSQKRPTKGTTVPRPPVVNSDTAASSPEVTTASAADRPTTASPAPATTPPAENNAVEADPLAVKPRRPAVPADFDHVAAITETLSKYYSASSWQDRYLTALPGPEVIRLMQPMYDDIDWISVEWSIAKTPTVSRLDAAAQSGERVRIDTLTNGNPHSIYVVFFDGRWRVDWLHSLNTLWLTK